MEILNVDWMYFTGIRDGKITAIFFDREKLHGVKKGDLFTIFYNTDNEVKMYFDSAKAISFYSVDDNLAKKAGFATKELLSSHLIEKYNLSTFRFGVDEQLRDELFYVVTFVDDPSKLFYDNGENKFNLVHLVDTDKETRITSVVPKEKTQLYYCKNVDESDYINEMYNPEYDN